MQNTVFASEFSSSVSARRTGRRRIRWGKNSRRTANPRPTPGRANFHQQNVVIDGYQQDFAGHRLSGERIGLYDMIGNVWEWTTDWFAPQRDANAQSPYFAPDNPRRAAQETSYDPHLLVVRPNRADGQAIESTGP